MKTYYIPDLKRRVFKKYGHEKKKYDEKIKMIYEFHGN